MKPDHPGVILKKLYLEPLNLSISEFSSGIGVSRKTISMIVNGRQSITADMSIRFSIALNTTPELWLNHQNAYDLACVKIEGVVKQFIP